MVNLALFASGGGSNAKKIIEYFKHHEVIKVACIVTNNEHAGIVAIAQNHQLPCYIISKKELKEGEKIKEFLKENKCDYIILAGFLLLIPQWLILNYSDRILNIHPSLLPKFGGKGMYGNNVHKAVISAGDKESGPTIHLVDEEYDKGKILFQAKCAVDVNDDFETLASKVLKLEHEHYSPVIEKYITSQKNIRHN